MCMFDNMAVLCLIDRNVLSPKKYRKYLEIMAHKLVIFDSNAIPIFNINVFILCIKFHHT